MHDIIYDELCRGAVRAVSREAYRRVIAGLVARGAQGIVLGCTEIMLLIGQEDSPVPVFDTTSIHAQAAVDAALAPADTADGAPRHEVGAPTGEASSRDHTIAPRVIRRAAHSRVLVVADVDDRRDVIAATLTELGMVGAEVSRHLRADPVTAAVPIIVTSAHDRLDALSAQMPVQDRLPKPFDFEAMYATVARWMRAA